MTGNDFSMGDSLGFNMSGETDGGLGVAVYYEIDGGALDDYDMTLSGDWGSLKFNGSGSSSALGAVDDVMPNAYEESWDILDTDGTQLQEAQQQSVVAVELTCLSTRLQVCSVQLNCCLPKRWWCCCCRRFIH